MLEQNRQPCLLNIPLTIFLQNILGTLRCPFPHANATAHNLAIDENFVLAVRSVILLLLAIDAGRCRLILCEFRYF